MSQHSSDFSGSLSANDILASAWRERKFAAFIFIGLMLLCVAVLLILPNRYVSNAQLLVRLGPNSVAMDPTSDLSKTVSLQESRLNQVNSVAELISSREMVERVVKRVGSDRILQPIGFLAQAQAYIGGLLPESPPDVEAGYSEAEVEDLVALGEACEAIESDYAAMAIKDAYTVDLEFVSNSPFLSHDIVATFLDEYPQYHVDAHQSEGSIDFFKMEVENTRNVAKAAADEVTALKNKYGIVEIGSAKEALRLRMTEIERDLNVNVSDLAGVDAELKQLSSEMETMPARIDSEKLTGVFKRSGDLVRDQLYELELKERELATKFRQDHPKMVAVRSQLEAAQEIAKREIGQEPQVLDVVNPNLQELDLAFRNALARQAGLKAKKTALEEQYAKSKEELVTLNNVELDIKQLSWKANVAESTYLTTESRLANAQQIESLGKLQVSDVSVAQPATLQVKKVGPKRALLGLVGMVMSGLISIALAAARGYQPQESQLASTSPTDRGEIAEQSDRTLVPAGNVDSNADRKSEPSDSPGDQIVRKNPR